MIQGAASSLLPGLRHARTPLVAGALWLLGLWLILGERLLPDSDGGQIDRHLFDLGGLLGRTVLLAGLVLLATLIGGLIPPVPVGALARRLPYNKRGRWWLGPLMRICGVTSVLEDARGDFDYWVFRQAAEVPADLTWDQFTGRGCPPSLQVAARDLADQGVAWIGGEQISVSDFASDPESVSPRAHLMWGLARASVATEVPIELPLRLQVEQEALFNDYDRVRAESQLRAAIVLPLTLLVGILSTDAWPWLFALAFPVWLLRQAVQTHVDAEQRLLSAVQHDLLRSSTIEWMHSLAEGSSITESTTDADADDQQASHP